MTLPSHLAQYQQRVLDLKKSHYMNWPFHVHVEKAGAVGVVQLF